MSDPVFYLTSCQHCGQHIQFPLEILGTSVACPHCAQATVLHGNDPPSIHAGQDDISAAELKIAMKGSIPERGISVFYQFGLLMVAVIMILLPVLYFAFVVLIALAAFRFGTRIESSPGRPGVIAYAALLLGVAIVVFFMVKPILAPRRRRAEPIELNPAHHPRLYEFIAYLSDLLRVPIPRQICLDCELGASVGLRRGWSSFFESDYVLHLGLPLVAAMNTRQFAWVVSHELGHCKQTLAMRLYYIIGALDGWFVRVVYERDRWDVSFDAWANSFRDSHWLFQVAVACFQAPVAFTRSVLAFLLHFGHATNCFLSRQMEFHADACAVEVAGSAAAESALLRLREQLLLRTIAYDGLEHFWKTRRQLPNSLPDFLQQLELRMPPTFHEEAQSTLLNETVGWFATHPTPAQRIQRARQQAVEGIFTMEAPARLLLNNFTEMAQTVTNRHYRSDFRLPLFRDHMLKPVGQFFSENNAGVAQK